MDIQTQTVNEGDTKTIDITANDAEGDTITLSTTDVSIGEFTDNGDGTGTILLSPDFDDADTYGITVSASDGVNTTTISFDVIVYDTNRPPVLDLIPDVLIAAGETGEFLVKAVDPDGDTITYYITPQSDTTSYVDITTNSNGTGTVTLSPPEDTQPISHQITVAATDNGVPSLYHDRTFTLGVGQADACWSGPLFLVPLFA